MLLFTMKLYLFHLGLMQPGNIPVPGYLIQTSEGRNILIDTGWPESFVDDPQGPPGIEVEIRPEDTITSRLDSVGLQPLDIELLICTHLDADHAGNNNLFTSAEHVIQRTHFEAARQGHPRFAPGRPYWDTSSLRYRLVEGDTTLLPGIELIETTGHVPGHQSVLVHLPETGSVLLAIDAVPGQPFIEAQTREILPMDMDETSVRASTEKLTDLVEEQDVALVVFGHDAKQWPMLRHAPDFYS